MHEQIIRNNWSSMLSEQIEKILSIKSKRIEIANHLLKH